MRWNLKEIRKKFFAQEISQLYIFLFVMVMKWKPYMHIVIFLVSRKRRGEMKIKYTEKRNLHSNRYKKCFYQ